MDARFEITGVVEDQHPVGVTDRVDDVAPHVIADSISVPHRLPQQPLHRLRRGVTGLLRQLPTRAGIDIGEHPEQERAGLQPRLPALEPTRDPREPARELLNPPGNVYAGSRGRHAI